MVAPLGSVIVKRPSQACHSPDQIQKESEALGYPRPPDLAQADHDHADFTRLLENSGAEILFLPEDTATGLDSLYAHDPALITDAGVVILQTGKPERRGEGPAFRKACDRWGVPTLGTVDGEATAEGGDLLWLDSETLVAGRSFRTNDAGIARLRELLEPEGITVEAVDLPYGDGPESVLHLMSLISLLDEDLAVIYRPLLPVRLFEVLSERGVEFVDTPEHEYATLGTNVLAIAPRNVVMVSGNPATRSLLEAAGCRVSEFDGSEICHPGAGGPTCLTRPLWRKAM